MYIKIRYLNNKSVWMVVKVRIHYHYHTYFSLSMQIGSNGSCNRHWPTPLPWHFHRRETWTFNEVTRCQTSWKMLFGKYLQEANRPTPFVNRKHEDSSSNCAIATYITKSHLKKKWLAYCLSFHFVWSINKMKSIWNCQSDRRNLFLFSFIQYLNAITRRINVQWDEVDRAIFRWVVSNDIWIIAFLYDKWQKIAQQQQPKPQQ